MSKLEQHTPYRRREGYEDCIICSIENKQVEYLSANTTGGVFSKVCSEKEFRAEFEAAPFYIDTVCDMLKRRAERCGASSRAKKLLKNLPLTARQHSYIGEVQMATKKSTPKPVEKAPTKTKKAEAPKKATPPAEKTGPGRKSAFNDGMKITVLVKENPKRAKAAERFALYKNGMTIGDYVAAGGTLADVRWDVKQQFISVK